MNLTILTWNARGLGSRARRRMIKDLVNQSGSEVVLVQESKFTLVDKNVIRESVLSTGQAGCGFLLMGPLEGLSYFATWRKLIGRILELINYRQL